METIHEIQTDTDYLQYTLQFLLLHNNQNSKHSHPSPVILLAHAPLLSFIEVFDDVNKCQGYIRRNNRNLYTLFASDRKLIEWNNTINVTEMNIDKVFIFCSRYSDFLMMKRWNGCYQTKLRDIYLSNTVEYHLLRLGLDHIHQILPEFQERGLQRKLRRQALDILNALSNYFQDKIQDIDDNESEECS